MSTDLRPALIGSALVHAGVALAGLWTWMERPPPPPPPASVPVMLVSAPPGAAPAPEPLQPLAEPEPPSLAPPPAEPAPPEPPPPTPPPPSPPPPAPTPTLRPAQTPPAKPRPTPSKASAPSPRPTPAKPTPPKATPPRPPPPQPAPPAPASLDLGALKSRLARNSARNAPAASSPGTSAADLRAAQAQLGARLQELWRPNCEAEGGSRVNVQVRFDLGVDGRVDGDPQVVGGFSGDALTRAAQERAVRAVLAGQPYDWLPKEALGVSYAPRFNAEQACAA